MAGPFQPVAVRQAVYRRGLPARLWRSAAWACALIVLVLPGGGCSTNIPIGAQKDEEKPLVAGSIGKPAVAVPSADPEENGLPPEADLAFAKVAVAEVLTKGGKDASLPWENPRSGARGTVTPLASAYRMEGTICRDFLASYVAEGEESWMQGEACRSKGIRRGKWEVRRLKPWRKT